MYVRTDGWMDACMHAYINAYENIRMNYCQKLPFIVDTPVRRRIFKLKKCSIRLLERFREAEADPGSMRPSRPSWARGTAGTASCSVRRCPNGQQLIASAKWCYKYIYIYCKYGQELGLSDRSCQVHLFFVEYSLVTQCFVAVSGVDTRTTAELDFFFSCAIDGYTMLHINIAHMC